MKVCVVLGGFSRGGAERQAAVTAVELASRGHDVQVLTFHAGDAYADTLESAGLRPTVIASSQWSVPLRLFIELRRRRPDVVLSYLAGPNVMSLVARPLRSRATVVWGVRSTTPDMADEVALGRLMLRLEPLASRWCDMAISNSHEGRRQAIQRGFRVPRFEVIPNGIDVQHWRPDTEAAVRTRSVLGLDPDAFVIGRVGRVHPMKDLPTLMAAMVSIDATLVVVGDGDPRYVAQMRTAARQLGVDDRIVWVGDRDDTADLYPAFDLTVSSSCYGEAFPNVIAESMACGVPCVASDIGDSAVIVDDPAMVVAPRDPAALASSIRRFQDLDRARRVALGESARRRIVEEFSIGQLGDRLESALESAVDARRGI